MGWVILDRDGVINFDSEVFIKSPREWQPIPGSLEAIARLNAQGVRVAVCTNQSGLARGLLNRADLAAIHGKMHAQVAARGGRIEATFVCPHGPDDGCRCRKPRPGLLHAWARRYGGASLAGVPVIGDSARDLEAAKAAGARPMLVLTGNGRRTLENLGTGVEHYADLATAAAALIEEGIDDR